MYGSTQVNMLKYLNEMIIKIEPELIAFKII